MARRSIRYKQDYVSYWNGKGQYGKVRVLRMMIRKKKRYEKNKNKVRNGLKRINGELYQVCDYQPLGSFNTSWCKYPCEGDC